MLAAALAWPVSGMAAARMDALTGRVLAYWAEADDLLRRLAGLLADN
jgi:hypothetical protein